MATGPTGAQEAVGVSVLPEPGEGALVGRSQLVLGGYLIGSAFSQFVLIIGFFPVPAEAGSGYAPVRCPGSLLSRNVCDLVAGLSKDTHELVLIIICGGIGATIHALRSFTAHAAAGSLTRRWVWWYFGRPFDAAVIALTFYLVLRGGVGGLKEGEASTPYAFAAIAVLTGMFSDQAIAKLKDIFETVFPKPSPPPNSQRGGEGKISDQRF